MMLRSNTVEADKAALRKRLRAELKKLSPQEQAAASKAACLLLEQQSLWHAAQTILFYAPLPGEIDLWRLFEDSLAAGKTVLLPRYEPEAKTYVACQIGNIADDLRAGQFGIREPREGCSKLSSNRLDLILVPGIGFDLNGHRLGRGKGYYDQLLTTLQGPTCGVAFDQQIVARIPVEPHDMRLSCILTPTRWHCANDPRAVLK
jgi:5-formyltetrahydrofolate cyclo-ligase